MSSKLEQCVLRISSLMYFSDEAFIFSLSRQICVPARNSMLNVYHGIKFFLSELLTEILTWAGLVVYACQHLNPIDLKYRDLNWGFVLKMEHFMSIMMVYGNFELRFEESQSFRSSSLMMF